jgi:very-short-patch-repair endonuclease
VIGRHIVDFCCREERLVVELDGGHHGEQINRDRARSISLGAAGYRVLRFWNTDVLENIEGVLEVIHEALTAPHRDPHLSPLPPRERTV